MKSKKNGKYSGSLLGAWGKKEIFLTDWLQEVELYEFEGKQFYGFKEYDKLLTAVYGDYMTLPPKEKQISHHMMTYLNTDLPYCEFKQDLVDGELK